MGADFARALAQQGYDLVLVARRLDRLDALADAVGAAHGVAAQVIGCDLSHPDAVAHIMQALEGRRVDLLINNAGYSLAAEYLTYDWPTQRDSIMTLVLAVCGLTHALLPAMVARGGGRVITISSILALSQGGPGHTLYPAEKAFVHLFMLSLAAEVRGTGVTVTSVLPGSTTSEFQAANGTAAAMAKLPRLFTSTPAQVVDAALKGSARGALVVIPGWHNKLLAISFKLMPNALVRWASARASRSFKGGSV